MSGAATPKLGREGDDDLRRAGRWVLSTVVVVAVGVSVWMNEGSPLAAENVAMLLLGGVFLAVLLVWGEKLPTLPAARRSAYYAVQLFLVSLLFVCQARLDSFGLAWIILMPLLVQGVMVEGRAAVTALALACFLLPAAHLLALVGWRRTLEPAAAVVTCIAFVILFAVSLRHQQLARRRSDELAAELAVTNRELAAATLRAEELAAARERTRLAREIHDAAGHSLTVASVQIEAATIHLPSDPERVRAALDHAAGAVRQGLSELRASVYALRESPLGPRALVDAVRELCEAAGPTPGIRLDIEGTPRPLPPDAGLALYRVAQEGLTNVRKHAPGSEARVLVDYRAADRVCLVVADDGPGLEAVGPETGYGLLGLRERLGLLGGRLVAGAAAGAGFELRAEVPTANAGDRLCGRVNPPPKEPIRVLLVDDQHLFRQGLATLLAARPEVEVVGQAADGHEALERVRELAPDVVLMDLRMPRLGGVEATARLTAHHPAVAVLVLTTFDEDEEVFAALRAGATGYLLKDCRADELFEALTVAARGETFLPPAIATRVVRELNRLRPRQADANQRLREPLSDRELEVLAALAQGSTNRRIAHRLHLAEGTVKNYVSSILAKLDTQDRTEAALRARDLGLLPGSNRDSGP